MKSFNKGFKRFWIAVGILFGLVLTAVVVFTLVNDYLPQGGNSTKNGVPQQPVTQQKLSLTPYQVMRRKLKPWHIKLGRGTAAPYLVMLEPNSSEEVSSKKVSVSASWHVASPIEIDARVPGKSTITIGAMLGSINGTYHLSYNQAFVLSDEPGYVYGFRQTGKDKVVLLGAPLSRVRL
jgi:hypothetical protein